jgi:hypothetical protein
MKARRVDGALVTPIEEYCSPKISVPHNNTRISASSHHQARIKTSGIHIPYAISMTRELRRKMVPATAPLESFARNGSNARVLW